jgi:uncharacterized protein YbjT (DUF2867 family)
MAQESLIKASGMPFTIVRSTQFFEFVNAVAQSATVGQTVRLSPALLQPIGSDDVAAAMADVALGAPLNDIIEIAGPERIPLDELARRYLRARKDAREVVADVHARYFGTELNDRSLTPGDHARLGTIRFEDWLGSHRNSQLRRAVRRVEPAETARSDQRLASTSTISMQVCAVRWRSPVCQSPSRMLA